MMRDDVEHFLAVADAAARRDFHAEHRLFAIVVRAAVEDERAHALGLENRPAGEAARGLGYVLLRVAAVDAESVQLQ